MTIEIKKAEEKLPPMIRNPYMTRKTKWDPVMDAIQALAVGEWFIVPESETFDKRVWKSCRGNAHGFAGRLGVKITVGMSLEKAMVIKRVEPEPKKHQLKQEGS